jgi:hypothetical protein
MPQLCSACNYVFLLHGGSDGSKVPEIHMVEEVHDLDTAGKLPLSLVHTKLVHSSVEEYLSKSEFHHNYHNISKLTVS